MGSEFVGVFEKTERKTVNDGAKESEGKHLRMEMKSP
jgi:hypothetical protein